MISFFFNTFVAEGCWRPYRFAASLCSGSERHLLEVIRDSLDRPRSVALSRWIWQHLFIFLGPELSYKTSFQLWMTSLVGAHTHTRTKTQWYFCVASRAKEITSEHTLFRILNQKYQQPSFAELKAAGRLLFKVQRPRSPEQFSVFWEGVHGLCGTSCSWGYYSDGAEC